VSRAGTVAIVNRFGVRAPESSFHAIGTDSGASGRTRDENAAIDVIGCEIQTPATCGRLLSGTIRSTTEEVRTRRNNPVFLQV